MRLKVHPSSPPALCCSCSVEAVAKPSQASQWHPQVRGPSSAAPLLSYPAGARCWLCALLGAGSGHHAGELAKLQAAALLCLCGSGFYLQHLSRRPVEEVLVPAQSTRGYIRRHPFNVHHPAFFSHHTCATLHPFRRCCWPPRWACAPSPAWRRATPHCWPAWQRSWAQTSASPSCPPCQVSRHGWEWVGNAGLVGGRCTHLAALQAEVCWALCMETALPYTAKLT